jgi:hypothetical protein
MSRKIESLTDLKLEQARLRMEVRNSEKILGERLDLFRRQYPSILLMQVLPFDNKKKDMIVSGLGFALQLAMGKIAESGRELLENKLQQFIHWISSKFGNSKSEDSPKD